MSASRSRSLYFVVSDRLVAVIAAARTRLLLLVIVIEYIINVDVLKPVRRHLRHGHNNVGSLFSSRLYSEIP